MNASSRDLAADLAERLNGALPDGLSARCAGAVIEVYSGGRVAGRFPALSIIDDDDDRGVTARIETATRAVLSGIQDAVIEDIRGPWPPRGGHGQELALPDCRVSGDELLVWFGDESTPALALPPITLRFSAS